jgi:transposase-like protein
MLIHKKYCYRCKCTDKILIKASKSGSGNIQYYVCRECNAARKREYMTTEQGREKVKAAVKRSIAKMPQKHKAGLLLNYAVKLDYIIKPKTCSNCGKETRIDGHHFDYAKALEVIWVCHLCHMSLFHSKLKA